MPSGPDQNVGRRTTPKRPATRRTSELNAIIGVTSIESRGEQTRRVAGLLGFLLKGEVDAIFRQQPFLADFGEDPFNLWRGAETRRKSLARQVSGLEEAGLNPQSTSLYRDAVLKSQRPALVVDFLNPMTAIPLRMKSMYQVMQVAINAGCVRVPALPLR
jgi:hypothetical protein